MSEYWKKYWNEDPIVSEDNIQMQIGRTRNKEAVSSDVWDKTLDFICNEMQLTQNSKVLELCCGNGMLTVPIAEKVGSITAIDFSSPLIDILNQRIQSNNIKNATIICEEINNINFPEESFSHALIYFALQHLTEKETVILFEKIFKVLKEGGIFYIGDIPDRAKLWNFANTDKYAAIYFESLKNHTPAIGTWFLQDDLLKMAKYAGFSNCKVVAQPEYQINSRYRFDILAQKFTVSLNTYLMLANGNLKLQFLIIIITHCFLKRHNTTKVQVMYKKIHASYLSLC